ncbi:MAG: DNA repair protein RadC [Acidimicrobiia bacterium]|nr:DNA repair protein RadC [Acidimicrobiia bacterium]
MKDVAPHDRPREKLERLGAAGLGDNELLALVIGSGFRDADALGLANRLLARSGGLHGLPRASLTDLRDTPGVGPARAAQIQAAVELGRRTLTRPADPRVNLASPEAMAAFLLPQFGTAPVERFGVVLLDTKKQLIRVRLIAVGSLDQTVVHPREVFKEAVAAGASALALFHNHPSGDPTPSPNDLALTIAMMEAGEVMGIAVIDHLILAEQRYFSLSEARWMPQSIR